MKPLPKITRWRSIVRELQILYTAYTDGRTPFATRALALVLCGGYLLYFFDFIPDFLPLIGIVDDAVIVPVIAALLSRLIPQEVRDDARQHILTHKK